MRMNKLKIFFALLVAIISTGLYAQDQPKGEKVELLGANELEGITINGQPVRKLKGNVAFKQKDLYLYCDSAYQYPNKNSIEAFGNVRMNQGDTITLTGNKLTYNGDTKKAEVRNNVVLKDRKMTLTTDFLDYDVNTKVAAYYNGGTIVDEENKLSSRQGVYSTQTKIFKFKKDVHIENIQKGYTIDSDTLHYNTTTKIATFKAPTKIVNKSGTLYADSGDYDTVNGVSIFQGRSRVVSGNYILEGKRIYYDQKRDMGVVEGDVKITAIKDSVIITGQTAHYWGNQGISKVSGNPVMKSFPEGDTLFLSADTLISIDNEAAGEKKLLAYNQTKIFKSDLQGKCDSLVYNMADSIIYFYNDPILWSGENQISADSINIELVNNKINKMNLSTNSFLISEDTLANFNQVKGKKMTAFFVNNELERVHVDGNSESIYFALEDDKVVIGMNKAECSNMIIKFENRKVNAISFLTKPDASFIPPHEIQGPEKSLKGFKWRIKEKPDKAAVLKQTSL
ncbi:MAG TPA: OstA-like protein [Cytophagaceae bacterium]